MDTATIERLRDALGFIVQSSSAGIDLERPDGGFVVSVKASSGRGLRDVRAGVMQLAMVLGRRPKARGCFVWRVPRLPGLESEWAQMHSVLRPHIGRRLALVAVATTADPSSRAFASEVSPETTAILEALQPRGGPAAASDGAWARALRDTPREPRWIAIAKVLMVRALLGQGPIARGALCEQAGCTLPTLAKALEGMGPRIQRRANRSVGFAEFPRQLFHEVATLSSSSAAQPGVRTRLHYVDRSGQAPDPAALARRLAKLRPPHVAFGGVVGARHWDPSFDLHGTPRLDLVLHIPQDDAVDAGVVELDFMRRLDPALALVRHGSEGATTDEADGVALRAVAPAVVIHAVRRPVDLFEPDPRGGLPWADPVEVLLDLHELRLVEQSEALIAHLTRFPRARGAQKEEHGGSRS